MSTVGEIVGPTVVGPTVVGPTVVGPTVVDDSGVGANVYGTLLDAIL